MRSLLPWRRWRETPSEKRFSAKRYDFVQREWLPCQYADLRRGDVFRAYDPSGRPINPLTEEVLSTDGELVGYCHADPIRGYAGHSGYAVEVSIGSYDDIIKQVSQ